MAQTPIILNPFSKAHLKRINETLLPFSSCLSQQINVVDEQDLVLPMTSSPQTH